MVSLDIKHFCIPLKETSEPCLCFWLNDCLKRVLKLQMNLWVSNLIKHNIFVEKKMEQYCGGKFTLHMYFSTTLSIAVPPSCMTQAHQQ